MSQDPATFRDYLTFRRTLWCRLGIHHWVNGRCTWCGTPRTVP